MGLRLTNYLSPGLVLLQCQKVFFLHCCQKCLTYYCWLSTQEVLRSVFYLFTFRERGREGEKHECVVVSHAPPTGDLACNPGMHPDWESNQRPFGLQAGAPSAEPRQSGQDLYFNTKIKYCVP